MLLSSNPFVNMNVAGVTRAANTLLETRRHMFSEDYASPARSFIICRTGSRHLPATTLLLRQPRQSAVVGKNAGKRSFPPQIVGNGRNISCRVLVSFVVYLAYGDIGIGSSLFPGAYFVSFNCAPQCVDRRWLWDDIAPQPALAQPLTPGIPVSGVFAFLRLLAVRRSCLRRVSAPSALAIRKAGVRAKQFAGRWRYYLPRSAPFIWFANILPIMITDYWPEMPSTILAGVICCGARGLIRRRRLSSASIMVPTC